AAFSSRSLQSCNRDCAGRAGVARLLDGFVLAHAGAQDGQPVVAELEHVGGDRLADAVAVAEGTVDRDPVHHTLLSGVARVGRPSPRQVVAKATAPTAPR